MENNSNWKTGKTIHQKGYVYARPESPYHPRVHSGYVLEHVLVMEKVIGRYLLPKETVHHKNGIKNDNSVENLELWTGHHPAGCRATDLVEWAVDFLRIYAPEKLK